MRFLDKIRSVHEAFEKLRHAFRLKLLLLLTAGGTDTEGPLASLHFHLIRRLAKNSRMRHLLQLVLLLDRGRVRPLKSQALVGISQGKAWDGSWRDCRIIFQTDNDLVFFHLRVLTRWKQCWWHIFQRFHLRRSKIRRSLAKQRCQWIFLRCHQAVLPSFFPVNLIVIIWRERGFFEVLLFK